MVKVRRLFAKTNLKIQVCIFLKKMYDIKKAQEVQMKAHKYFAFSSLICMAIAIYSGHKMISGKSRKKKETAAEESAE